MGICIETKKTCIVTNYPLISCHMNVVRHKEIIYSVIGAAMEVHRVLGGGLLEPIYNEALFIELRERGIDCFSGWVLTFSLGSTPGLLPTWEKSLKAYTSSSRLDFCR